MKGTWLKTVAVGSAIVVLLNAQAFSHDALHRQLQATSGLIAQNPLDPDLLVKRAELWRLLGNFRPALTDLDRAARLDPALATVELSRGRVLHQAGQLRSAKRVLDQLIRRHPEYADALRERSMVLKRLGRPSAAASDLARVVQRGADPDDCAQRARLQVAAGDPQAAVTGLDECMQRLGAYASLQPFAIQIQIAQGSHSSALVRHDTLRKNSAEYLWWTQRGELLRRLGRSGEAQIAFREALRSITALSKEKRGTRAVTRLQRALERRSSASVMTRPQHRR
jgi:tetratricopeptide (TPR) repeat protein